MNNNDDWTTNPTIINHFNFRHTYMFVDESGNGSLKDMKKAFLTTEFDLANLRNEIYMLNGVIMNGIEYTKLNSRFSSLKKDITFDGKFDYSGIHKNYGIRPINLHNRELEGKIPPFNELDNDFYTKLNDSIEISSFTQITSGLNYMGFINNKTFDESMNPLLLCLNELIIKYALYLNEKGIKGAVVFESDNEKVDKLKLQFILQLKENGTISKSNTFFKNIVGVYFRPKWLETKKVKLVTCAGLELADLTISPMRKIFSLEFLIIERHLYDYPFYGSKAINTIR